MLLKTLQFGIKGWGYWLPEPVDPLEVWGVSLLSGKLSQKPAEHLLAAEKEKSPIIQLSLSTVSLLEEDEIDWRNASA